MGGLTPEAWYEAQQRAVALRIEQAQQQAQATCAQHGEGSLECAQAWERANQTTEGLTREAALQPQAPFSKPSIATALTKSLRWDPGRVDWLGVGTDILGDCR